MTVVHKLAGSVISAIFAIAIFTITHASAQQSEPGKIDDKERQKIEKIVRDYLLRNPEILVEMSTILDAKQQAQQQIGFRDALASIRKDLMNDSATPSTGNPDGKTVIVEFSDYNCPYCRKMAPLVKSAIKDNPDLKVVMREFPILGPSSRYAARAALAAKFQNKYQEMHWAMISHQGRLNNATIDRIASEAGLDMKLLKADMRRPEIEKMIAKNLEYADKLGIRGTPAFIAGDTLAPGALSKEAFQSLLKAASPKG